MLVYSRLIDEQNAPAQDIANLKQGSHRAPTEPSEVPPRAKAVVLALNESHTSACKIFEDKYDAFVSEFAQRSESWRRKQETLAQFDQVRQRIMSIMRSWNPTSRKQVRTCKNVSFSAFGDRYRAGLRGD